MNSSLLASIVLLVCAGLACIRPQWLSTIRHYSDAERRNIELKRVRRTVGGGLLLLALLTGAGGWVFVVAGVPETTRIVLQILVLFVGVIAIVARVEKFNHNR